MLHNRFLCACFLALFPIIASSAEETDPNQLLYVETPDLRLIYFAPLGYVVPYAVRSFKNSLAWQRRTFDWSPSEKTTILLSDYADFGNARAVPAPHNSVIFDVAPVSRAFETYPASERMYSFMNHEMVHIANDDVSNDACRRPDGSSCAHPLG